MNNKNLSLIAPELFEKIRAQFPSIRLTDQDGKATTDPQNARMFAFSFEKGSENLGTVTLSIVNEDGIVVLFSNSMLDGVSTGIKRNWFNFLRELREFAKQRFLNFDIRDITKSNLEKRDINQLSQEQHGDGQMTESKSWGTSKVSYQTVGESRLVIRHSQPINAETPGSRTRNIESIYIENAQGERFKYPYRHLNGARAMARHISNGGTPYDSIGEHVTGLSEELSKLRMFKRYVERNDMVAEAMNSINPRVVSRIDEIKKVIQGLQSQRFYSQFAESFVSAESKQIPEDIMNDWIDRLTVRTFNEELKNVFPYIFRLVDESDIPARQLTVEDLIPEDQINSDVEQIFRDLASGELDIFDVYSANATIPAEKAAQDKLHQMYDQAAQEHNLYPSDDFEEILDIVQKQISQEYGDRGHAEDREMNQYESLLNSIIGEGSDILSDDESSQSAALEKLKDLVSQPLPVGTDGTNAIESLHGIIDDSELHDIFKELADVDPEFDARPIIKDYLEIHDKENGTDLASQINIDGDSANSELPPPPAAEEPQVDAPVNDAEVAPAEEPVTASFDHEELDSELVEPKDEIHEFVESMFDKETGNFPKGETGVLLSVEKRFGPDAVPKAQHAIEHLVAVTESYRIRKLAGLSESASYMCEGAIKDAEAALAQHGQYKIDFERKYGPMSGHELHQHEVIRKQLLAKKRRAQQEYAKKMDRATFESDDETGSKDDSDRIRKLAGLVDEGASNLNKVVKKIKRSAQG